MNCFTPPHKTGSIKFMLLVFVAMFMATSFTSCDKDSVNTASIENSNSIMSFTNQKELVQLLSDNSVDEFEEIIGRTAPDDFVSYETYFEQVEDEIATREEQNSLPDNIQELVEEYPIELVSTDDGYEIEPIVKSILYRRISNKDRVLQIGDELYQYNSDKVLIANVSDVTDLTDLSKASQYREEIYVEGFTNKRRLEGIADDNYTRSGDAHRLKARWYSRDKVKVGSLDFSEVFIEMKHQRKGSFGIWYANKEDRIEALGHLRCYVDSQETSKFYNVDRGRSDRSSYTTWIQEEPRSYPLDQNKPDDGNWVRGGRVRHTTEDDGSIRGDVTIHK